MGISNIRCASQPPPPNGKIVPCGTGNSRAERSRVFKVSCLLPKHCRRVRSLLRAKREPERTAVLVGHESPSGAFKPQTGLRSKCRVFSAARTGGTNQGLLAPSNPKAVRLHTKNPSRFAKGFFVFRRLESPQSLRDSSPKWEQAHPRALRSARKLCRHAKGPIPEGAVCAADGGVFSPKCPNFRFSAPES